MENEKGAIKMNIFTARIVAFLIAAINFICGLFGIKSPVEVKKIDMSKFQSEPTFYEEFEGDSLNKDVWSVHGGDYSIRRGAYWTYDMAEVYGNALHIKTKYLYDGAKGPGWYSSGIHTKNSFMQTYGYFECRCILPEGYGHWSAFWLTPKTMHADPDGLRGAEIDIMESEFWRYPAPTRNATRNTIHYGGYGDTHQSVSIGPWSISGNPYREFHTYAVEWNKEGYSFYIDGEFKGFTEGGGASQVDEYILLTDEVGGENGIPGESWVGKSIEENEAGRSFESDFVVDYVKVYQYK